MSADTPVQRTHAWIEREYGSEKWPTVERIIAQACRFEGEQPTLGRVLGLVESAGAHAPELAADRLDLRGAVFGGRTASVPRSVARGALQNFVVDTIRSLCTPETELVADLGSGWGHNLLSVWLSGGPHDALYVAAEYTESGRRAAATLAALEPALHFQAVPFDYLAPDLSMLDRVQHAVVSSVQSIEQIARVTPALFEQLYALGERVSAVHLEPLGWQLGEEGDGISTPDYAERHDYSRNFVEVLRAEEAAGRLVVDAVLPNVVGTNPANALTAVLWHAG